MIRRLLPLSVAVLLLSAGAASAQQPNCVGRNLLDQIKTAEPEMFAAIRKSADAVENARHVLYKIEQKDEPDRAASYLFGTLAVTDERVHRLPKATAAALAAARYVAVEHEDGSLRRITEALNTLDQKGVLQAAGDRTLETMLTPAEIQRAGRALAKSGLQPAVFAKARPWVALVALSPTDCERSRLVAGKRTLDEALADNAEMRGVGTLGLEPMELRYQALADLPEPDQLALLKAEIALQSRVNDMTETLVQLYLARDLGAMWPLQAALGMKSGAERKTYDLYEEEVIGGRNRRMMNRVHGHLVRGGVFIAVGALHLQGKSGLVAQMKDAGFIVTPIE